MDCSLPGSSVRGVSQARALERAAVSSRRVVSLMALLSGTETPLDCGTHTHTHTHAHTDARTHTHTHIHTIHLGGESQEAYMREWVSETREGRKPTRGELKCELPLWATLLGIL